MPTTDEVRLALRRRRAEEMVAEEYDHDDGYDYSPEQRERNERNRRDRVRWLMRGPLPEPRRVVLDEKRRRRSATEQADYFTRRERHRILPPGQVEDDT